MTWIINRFLKDKSGATVPEYALIVALVVVGCLGALEGLGVAMNGTFSTVAASFNQLRGAPLLDAPPHAPPFDPGD
jgi:Flp pilus assembly pilin Flp